MWRNTVARWTALSKHSGAAGSKYFAGQAMTSCFAKEERHAHVGTPYRLLLQRFLDRGRRHLFHPSETILAMCFRFQGIIVRAD